MKTVQDYLLGTLGQEESASLELQYFTDREFFLHVQSAETELIRNYLKGRLTRSVCEVFEKRYLTIPELNRRVEEARRRLTSPPERARLRLKSWPALVLAGTTVILIFGGILFERQLRVEALPAAAIAQQIRGRLTLQPGVLMAGDGGGRLVLPNDRGAILVTLDLPVAGRPVTCGVQLSEVTDGGGLETRWTAAAPILSSPAGGRQQLSVVLDSRVLHSGDFVVELTGLDRPFQATYLFRAVASQ